MDWDGLFPNRKGVGRRNSTGKVPDQMKKSREGKEPSSIGVEDKLYKKGATSCRAHEVKTGLERRDGSWPGKRKPIGLRWPLSNNSYQPEKKKKGIYSLQEKKARGLSLTLPALNFQCQSHEWMGKKKKKIG